MFIHLDEARKASIVGWDHTQWILHIYKEAYGPYRTADAARRAWETTIKTPLRSWECGCPIG
jgi:hypothetical protein